MSWNTTAVATPCTIGYHRAVRSGEAVDIEKVLTSVIRPARYSGGEWNAVVKEWAGAQVRLALVYPDVYEVGAASLALAILYELFNGRPEVLAERAYAPWADMEQAMRQAGLPLFSLESRRPLSQFDIIYLSLSYELTYTNVLTVLDLAGLPLSAAQRGAPLPLVVAGGRGALNPEPLADFIDAFILGDGEEPLLALTELVRRFKVEGGAREDLLRALSHLPGVYVPSLYHVRYGADGTVAAVEPSGGAPSRPQRQLAARLPQGPQRPVVPYIQTVHDRAVLEVQRGVADGCRCCQIGVERRAVLRRDPAETAGLARELLARTGYSELFLVAPAPVEGTSLLPTLEALRRELGEQVVAALPSLAVEGFGERLAQALAGPGRSTIAFTPEAASPRLRRVIGRAASEEEVLAAAEAAYRHGFTNVRLHFKVGLPSETSDDVRALGELASQARALGRRYHGSRGHLRLGVTPFVPRPHTPFQWARQETAEELAPKCEMLKRACRRAGVELSLEEPGRSLLEAVLARGDRRQGAVIRRAWELGCRLDAWREHYRWPLWEQAFAEVGLSPSFYAHREPPTSATLPWSHLDLGVGEDTLRAEWERALGGEGGAAGSAP